MITRPPAEIGMPVEEIDTPALLLDLEAFERNLQRMASAIADTPIRLRPHAKTHKCPVIALRQIAHGAVGVCCQKVSEAEAMVYGGVTDVLISNEVVGTPKLHRLASLARQARVMVCVDDPGNITDLNEVALAYKIRLSVLVEVNVGANRCGVEPGEPVLQLVQHITQLPGLRFAGLQAYHGAAQHIRDFVQRLEAIQSAVEKVDHTLDLLQRHGFSCPIISGGGTGTYRFEAESQVYTELQAGSYIFMDMDYSRNLDVEGKPWQDFEQSLFVYTTVMSRPTPDRAVVDAGLKALSVDAGMPGVYQREDLEYVRASDEHGKLVVHDPDCTLRVGDKIRLIPGHCDPTVNLYDWYIGIRGDRVEAIWPITARGAVL
ncbi:MAG: DSD1 family PLP-dependent enzyme [Nitrospinota bacterium]|nr:MAG: DSD1 family PLP-dependent enzyme [Nitrospinota bacterium]